MAGTATSPSGGWEQYVRDARISMIYEGTNGIQAMDLVGRKLALNGGRAVQAFFRVVTEEIAAAKGEEKLKDYAEALEKALGQLQAATMWLAQNGFQNPNHVGAGAYPYMQLTGTVALGLMWLRMAKAAADALAEGADDAKFYEAKLVTARFYAERILPDAGALRRKIEAGSDAVIWRSIPRCSGRRRIGTARVSAPPWASGSASAREG